MARTSEKDKLEISHYILEHVPREAEVTRVEYEGPMLSVYAKKPEILVDQSSVVAEIVGVIRKRIVAIPVMGCGTTPHTPSEPSLLVSYGRQRNYLLSKAADEVDNSLLSFRLRRKESLGDRASQFAIEFDRPRMHLHCSHSKRHLRKTIGKECWIHLLNVCPVFPEGFHYFVR